MSELLGFAVVLAFFTIAAWVHARRTRDAVPAQTHTPAPGRATTRLRDWYDREPVDLDHLDGLPPRCWSSGPRGGHDYRNKARDGVWTCARCGDVREAS